MSEPAGQERAPGRSRPRRKGVAPGSTSRTRFERLVAEALENLPEAFQSRLENVAIVIAERPSSRQLKSVGIGPGGSLLGLYEGIPLTERGDSYNLVSPDKITLFRRPILAMSRTSEQIREQVKITVLHEVAHFYGISDEELDRMGYS